MFSKSCFNWCKGTTLHSCCPFSLSIALQKSRFHLSIGRTNRSNIKERTVFDFKKDDLLGILKQNVLLMEYTGTKTYNVNYSFDPTLSNLGPSDSQARIPAICTKRSVSSCCASNVQTINVPSLHFKDDMNCDWLCSIRNCSMHNKMFQTAFMKNINCAKYLRF